MRIRFNASADLRDVIAKMAQACRQFSGETLAQVAKRTGYSSGTVWNVENGRGSIGVAWDIVRAFGTADVELTLDLEK